MITFFFIKALWDVVLSLVSFRNFPQYIYSTPLSLCPSPFCLPLTH